MRHSIKNGLLILIISGLGLGIGNSLAAGNSFVLDLSQAEVGFTTRVLGIFPVTGRFDQVHGNLLFNESCTASGISFSINSASVNTRDTQLDKLLRSPILLNSQHYPVIVFSSNRIVLDEQGSGMVTGKLELNGITREVSFELLRVANSASTRFSANTRINRKDFGITALPVAVSNYIDISINIRALPENIRLADATTGGFQND